MVLQSSGSISLGNVKAEYGGSPSPQLSDYYRGGAYVPSVVATVPAFGNIGLSTFRGTTRARAPTITHNSSSATPTLISGVTHYVSFTSTVGTNSFTFPQDTQCDLLVVGGGGSGGTSIGGGGGAGGVVYMVNKTFVGGTTYSVTVGAGGASPGNGPLLTGNNGQPSFISVAGADVQFDGINVRGLGGGCGGSYYNNANSAVYNPGKSGGSGGGAADNNEDVNYPGGSATQGNTYWNASSGAYTAGGAAGRTTAAIKYFGSGGGGMGVPGATYKDGHSGVQNSITGVPVWYAAGGGGGTASTADNGVGGNGAGSGGRGGIGYKYVTSAASSTGSGGGGGGYSYIAGDTYEAGAGGSGVVILRFVANPAFTPRAVGSLANWFLAASENVVFSSGTVMSQWTDISGNGRHATQSTASFRPSLDNTLLNGRPSVNFGGAVGSLLNFSSVDSPTFTIAAVMRLTLKSTFSQWLSTAGAWRPGAVHLLAAYGSRNLQFSVYAADNISSYAFTDGTPFIIVLTGSVSEGGLSVITPYVNGTAYAAGPSQNVTNYLLSSLNLGGWNAETGRTLNGSISEFVIYNQVLTSTERAQLEGYLAHRWWGSGSVLPAAHAFKSFAP